MKYRTFKLVVGLVLVGTGAGGVFYVLRMRPAPVVTAPVVTAPVVPSVAAPVAAGAGVSTPGSPPPDDPPANRPIRPRIAETRAELEAWLTAHADRDGAMRAEDILPNASYRATAIRFPPADAVRWSNDPSQWSQIRLDLNRDGVDDEKWLLRNGHTYKREVLAPDGQTVVGTLLLDG